MGKRGGVDWFLLVFLERRNAYERDTLIQRICDARRRKKESCQTVFRGRVKKENGDGARDAVARARSRQDPEGCLLDVYKATL